MLLKVECYGVSSKQKLREVFKKPHGANCLRFYLNRVALLELLFLSCFW